MAALSLPQADGTVATYTLRGNATDAAPGRAPWNRIAFAAAHVVADPRANIDPWLATAIDWDATLAYRRYLWQQGFGVAEAMDTAQRGMGLTWPTSLELMRARWRKRAVLRARSCSRAPAPTTSRPTPRHRSSA
jgi:hypothetical protein